MERSGNRFSMGFHENSDYKCSYHLILVTKYRREVITETIFNGLVSIFKSIWAEHGIEIVEVNYESDHIHFLIDFKPTTNIVSFLNGYKSRSSRVIKTDFPEIKDKLWKEFFWSRAYCLMTVGWTTLETIKKYIDNQKKL